MSRIVSTGFSEELDQTVIQPFLAVDLLFDSPNELYFWTGLGNLEVGGNTYIGTADILNISPIEETTEIAARGAQFIMTGLPASLVSLALTEPYQGRIAKVYFGLIPMPARLLAEDGSVLTAEDLYPISIAPDINTEFVEIFSGYMDVMSINDASDTATIAVSVENRLIDLERARSRRYTSEDQKQISGFTTDAGFDFVTDMQDKEIRWGG